MSKDSRSGGKFGGSHTTMIPAAALVADIAVECPFVTSVVPGFIKAGLKSVNGQKRVKISENGAAILLAVRDNTSHQEIRVYSKDMQETKLAIARGSRKEGLQISFGKS